MYPKPQLGLHSLKLSRNDGSKYMRTCQQTEVQFEVGKDKLSSPKFPQEHLAWQHCPQHIPGDEKKEKKVLPDILKMVVHSFGSDFLVFAVDNGEDVDWWNKYNGDSDENFVDDENRNKRIRASIYLCS